VLHAVEDEQHVVAVLVELRALAEVQRVLDRQLVPAEDPPGVLDGLRPRGEEVEPEVLAGLPQLGDACFVDAIEDLHRRGF
jgi:hypothetical protein